MYYNVISTNELLVNDKTHNYIYYLGSDEYKIKLIKMAIGLIKLNQF
jgi:hypothetical protein